MRLALLAKGNIGCSGIQAFPNLTKTHGGDGYQWQRRLIRGARAALGFLETVVSIQFVQHLSLDGRSLVRRATLKPTRTDKNRHATFTTDTRELVTPDNELSFAVLLLVMVSRVDREAFAFVLEKFCNFRFPTSDLTISGKMGARFELIVDSDVPMETSLSDCFSSFLKWGSSEQLSFPKPRVVFLR